MLQHESNWMDRHEMYNWFRFHRSVRAHTTTKTSIASKWLFFSLVLSRCLLLLLNWYVRFAIVACIHTHSTCSIVNDMWWEKIDHDKRKFYRSQFVRRGIVELQPSNLHLIQMEPVEVCMATKWTYVCNHVEHGNERSVLFVVGAVLWWPHLSKYEHTQRSHFGCICLTDDRMAFNHRTIHANNDLIRIYFMGFCYIHFG